MALDWTVWAYGIFGLVPCSLEETFFVKTNHFLY